MSLIAELKRRNVFRVGVAYVVAAWLILQLTEVLSELMELESDVGKIVIILLVVGFIPALIFAWAFELTPEGIKRESAVDPGESITHVKGRKFDFAIIGLLAIALIFVVVDNYVLEYGPEPVPLRVEPVMADIPTARESSIAVLPFINMSSDPEQEYFSDGITEEIINRLASMRELQVTARTSVFSFKGQNHDVREIAQKLGVSNILEGSVRKSGDQVRITAQLIRASDGFHLWSEVYDRKLENIFAIQDDIANQIAAALEVSLGISTRAGSLESKVVDPEVYDLYLRARALHRKRGEGLMQAIDLFQQALAIDPNFAPAWAGLSHSYIVVINYVSVEDMEKLGDVFSKSLASAEKALELDPGLPTALHAMGNNLLFRVEWAEAETYYKRALELDPDSADIMEDYVSLLNNSWQLSTARSVAEHMIELDPYVSVFHNAMIAVLDSQGELELRDEHIRQALEINPDMGNIQTSNLNRLLQERRYEEARDYARQMNTFRYGSVENLHQLIDWVENPAQQPGPGLMEALGNDARVALIAGRYDLWLASIEAAGAIWPEWEVVTSTDLLAPMTTPELMHQYRADPRTKEFLNRLRLPDYWRQVGWPEQCQPISETDFECH